MLQKAQECASGMILSLLVLFAFLAILLTITRPPKVAAASSQTLDFQAMALRYRPMARLLDPKDFDIVNARAGSKAARRMRSQRRRLFWGYMRSLRRDHAMLCGQLRLQIVASDCPRQDLFFALYRLEYTFRLLVLAVSLRVLLHTIGVREIPLSGLLSSFDQLRSQTETLAHVPAAA